MHSMQLISKNALTCVLESIKFSGYVAKDFYKYINSFESHTRNKRWNKVVGNMKQNQNINENYLIQNITKVKVKVNIWKKVKVNIK